MKTGNNYRSWSAVDRPTSVYSCRFSSMHRSLQVKGFLLSGSGGGEGDRDHTAVRLNSADIYFFIMNESFFYFFCREGSVPRLAVLDYSRLSPE